MRSHQQTLDNLARNIIHLRETAGYLQKDLSDALGVSTSAICRWQQGNRIPDIYTLYRLSRFFGITIEDLIDDNPPTPNIEEGVTIDAKTLDYARSVDARHSPDPDPPERS